ncbi:MAG: 50S ribosomal protein L6 [Thermoleophilia bacterium]|jgi:large subunit ribosomal protein L6|nr:50S ribosomal protein L6 [Thermoleophilia bacterium]
MSRIGKAPISVPSGVDITIDGNVVAVKGPKGRLTTALSPEIIVSLADGVISVSRPSDAGRHRALHGLSRTLVANMVTGVTAGFEKRLDIVGVGYRAILKGQDLEIQAGYSHPVLVSPPENIEFEVPIPTQIVVRGIDKQQVGQIAANIRAIRKPEPYKGKGIRYQGEVVRRKVGKRA